MVKYRIIYRPGADMEQFISKPIPVVFFIPKGSKVRWENYGEVSNSPYKSGLTIKELVSGKIPPDVTIAFKMDFEESVVIVRISAAPVNNLSDPVTIQVYLMADEKRSNPHKTNVSPNVLKYKVDVFKSLLLDTVRKYYKPYDPNYHGTDDSEISSGYNYNRANFTNTQEYRKVKSPNSGYGSNPHISTISAPFFGNNSSENRKEISLDEASKTLGKGSVSVELDGRVSLTIRGALVKVTNKTLQTKTTPDGKKKEILGTKETDTFKVLDVSQYSEYLKSENITKRTKVLLKWPIFQERVKGIGGLPVEWKLFEIEKRDWSHKTGNYYYRLTFVGYVSALVDRKSSGGPSEDLEIDYLPIESILFVTTETKNSVPNDIKMYSSSNIDYLTEEKMDQKVSENDYQIKSREEMFRQLFLKSREKSKDMYVTINSGPISAIVLGFVQMFTNYANHLTGYISLGMLPDKIYDRMFIDAESWLEFNQYKSKSIIGVDGKELSDNLYDFYGTLSRKTTKDETIQQEYIDSVSLKSLVSDESGSVVYKVVDVQVDGIIIEADHAFKHATNSGDWDVISNPTRVEMKSKPVIFIRFGDVSVFGPQVLAKETPRYLRSLMFSKAYRLYGYTTKEYAILVSQWLTNAMNGTDFGMKCTYEDEVAAELRELGNGPDLGGFIWNKLDIKDASKITYYGGFDVVKDIHDGIDNWFSVGSINVGNGTAFIYRLIEPHTNVDNRFYGYNSGNESNYNYGSSSTRRKILSNTVDIRSLNLDNAIPFFSSVPRIRRPDILSQLDGYRNVHELVSDYLKVYENDEDDPIVILDKSTIYELCSDSRKLVSFEIYSFKDVSGSTNEEVAYKPRRSRPIMSLSHGQLISLGIDPNDLLKSSLSPQILGNLSSLPSIILDVDPEKRHVIFHIYFGGIPLDIQQEIPAELKSLNTGFTLESADVKLSFNELGVKYKATNLAQWKSIENKAGYVDRNNGPPRVVVDSENVDISSTVDDETVGDIKGHFYNSESVKDGNNKNTSVFSSSIPQIPPVEPEDIDKMILRVIKSGTPLKIRKKSELLPLSIKVLGDDNNVRFKSFRRWLFESGISTSDARIFIDIDNIITRTGGFIIEKYNKTTGQVKIISPSVLSIVLPGGGEKCKIPINTSMKFSTAITNFPSFNGNTPPLISSEINENYGDNDDKKYRFTKLDVVRVEPEYGTRTLPKQTDPRGAKYSEPNYPVVTQSEVNNVWSMQSQFKDSVSGGILSATDNIHIPSGISPRYEMALLEQFKKQADKEKRTVFVPTTLEINPLPYRKLDNVPYIYETYPDKSAATKVSNDIVNLYADTQNISITIAPGVTDVILGSLGAVINWSKVAIFLAMAAAPHIISGSKQENLGWGNALSKNVRKWRKAVLGMYLKRFKGLNKDQIVSKFADDLQKQIASKLSDRESARKYLLTRSVEELLLIPKLLVLLMYKLKLLNQDAMDQLVYEKYISPKDIDNYVIPPEIPREALSNLLGEDVDNKETEEPIEHDKEVPLDRDISITKIDDKSSDTATTTTTGTTTTTNATNVDTHNPQLVKAISLGLGLGLGGGVGFGAYGGVGYRPYYPGYGPYYDRYRRRYRPGLRAGINVGLPVTTVPYYDPYYIGSQYNDYKTLAPLLDYQKIGVVPIVAAPVAAAGAAAATPWIAIAIFGAAVIGATGLIASKVLPGMLDRWLIRTGGVRQVTTDLVNKTKRGLKNIVLILKGKNKEERLKILTDDALERSRKMSPKERANIIASQPADSVLMLDEEVIKSLIENNLLTVDQYNKIIASKKYPDLENIDVSTRIYNPKYVEEINSKPTSYWRAQPQSVIIPFITRCTFTGPYMNKLIEDGIIKTSDLQGVDCWKKYLLEYRKKKKPKKSTKKSSSKTRTPVPEPQETTTESEETTTEVNAEEPKETKISADIYHLSKGFTQRDNYVNDNVIGDNLQDDTPPKEYLLKVLHSMKLGDRDVLKHFTPFVFSIKRSSKLFRNGYQGGVVVLSVRNNGIKHETVIDTERVRMMVFILRNVESGGCVSASLFFSDQSLEPTDQELWDSLHKTYASNEEYEWYKVKKFANYRVKSRMFMHIGGPGLSTPKDCNQFIDFVFSTLGDLGLSEMATPIIIKSKSITSNIECRSHCKNMGLTQKPDEPYKWYGDEVITKNTYQNIIKSISSPYYSTTLNNRQILTPAGYTHSGTTTFIDTGVASSQPVDMSDTRLRGDVAFQRSSYLINSAMNSAPKTVIVQRPRVTTEFDSNINKRNDSSSVNSLQRSQQVTHVMRELSDDLDNTKSNRPKVLRPIEKGKRVFRSVSNGKGTTLYE